MIEKNYSLFNYGKQINSVLFLATPVGHKCEAYRYELKVELLNGDRLCWEATAPGSHADTIRMYLYHKLYDYLLDK